MSELAPPSTSLLDLYEGSEILPLYTTTVTVSGGEVLHGRASGKAESQDGELNLDLRLPRELGGQGGGTNPEQLFAAGYAACFHGALSLAAAKMKLSSRGVTVSVSVHVTFGRDPKDGLYLLTAEVSVLAPHLERSVAQELVDQAETFCPYAKMGRQGIAQRVALV